MQIPVPPRRVSSFVLSLALAGGVLIAQQKPASPAGERVQGLLVDFIAVSPDGLPVTDLTAADVAIRINGRVRPIQSLRLIRVAEPHATIAAPGAAAPSPLPPPYGANSRSSSTTGRNVILAIDDDSFRAGSEKPIREAVEGLFAALTPRDQVLLVTMPYGGVKVPFTEDRARVRAALSGLSGQRAQNETGSDMACRTRRVLESLTGFLDSLAGGETPATVVFFTAGLAGPRRDALAGLAPGMCELEVQTFRRVAASAIAARATFYLAHPDDVARGTTLGTGARGSDNPLEGIEHLAGVTGAERLPLLAVGRDALARVARESSAYYIAEIAPERADQDGDSRRLGVRVARAGVTVRARPAITFAAPRPLAPKTAIPTTHQMLRVVEEFADLPMRVAGFTTQGTDGKLKVIAIAESSDPSAILATAATALVDGAGRIVAQSPARDAAEFPLAIAMLVPPGTYRLRVAATDTRGRFGTADTQVLAALTPAGPLTLSSLVLGLSRDGALSPRLEFGSEPVAIASFELYGATPAGMRVTPVLDVARTVDGPALVSIPLALERAADDRLIATGAVPIGALPPGDYAVRGTIGIEGGPAVTIMRTMRKVVR